MGHLSLEDIQKRSHEIQTSFSGINFENEDGSKAMIEGLESIKHEAAALWISACKHISGKDHELENGKTR